MADTYDITAVKGDTIRFAFFFTNTAGAIYNLTGCTLSMDIRQGYYPANLIASYSLYVAAGAPLGTLYGLTGGIAATATGGTVYIAIGSTYTINLSDTRQGKYDLQLKGATTQDITTLLRGTLYILPDVTNG